MRTKRATKYSDSSQHNQYGIYNWFRSKGITEKDIIFEVIYSYRNKEKENLDCMKNSNKQDGSFEIVAKEFQKFSPFAMNYLRENNYIK